MVSDDFDNDALEMDDVFELEMTDEAASEDLDDYEEIATDEVDRVLAVLEELVESVESENIRYYLEEAADNIFSLVYEEEDGEEGEGASSEAA